MKKISIAFLLLLISTKLCYSQQCLSDEYLQTFKDKNPNLESEIQKIISSFNENNLNSSLAKQTQQVITIPVVFNIIHYGEPLGQGRNIPDYRIHEQIDLLNAAFSGQFGGVDTNIQFCLATHDIIGIETSGIYRFFGEPDYDFGEDIGFCYPNFDEDSDLKSHRSNFPPSLFLNIWVADLLMCDENVLQGYSSFPYPYTPEIDNLYDGVVLDYEWVGNNTSSFPVYVNSLGFTAVHEIGHWLGLFHVFEDFCSVNSCYSEGDLICDTENVPSNGITNIAGDPTACWGLNCDGTLTPAVRNFMDYQTSNRQHCFTTFTHGQKERMLNIMQIYRYSIYNQAGINTAYACGAGSSGGGGTICNEDPDLPVQKIFAPNIQNSTWRRNFGSRLEVNDKWLVTIDTDANINSDVPDYIHIYKREGCLYALTQSFELPFWDVSNIIFNDFGLTISDNEIIVSSYRTDSAYIYHFDDINNTWLLNQQIQNNSSSKVGTSTFILGKFLFILESNTNTNGVFRIYYKNSNGNYYFHQTLSVSGFNLPSLGKYIQPANFIESTINISSNTFNGSYDPPELLVTEWDSGSNFALLGLNSSNLWTTLSMIQPTGMPNNNNESILDIELSKNYIHVLTSTQLGEVGSPPDRLNLFSYKIVKNNLNPFHTSDYKKQILIENTNNIFYDSKFKIFNDQFLIIDGLDGYPLHLFYNQEFGDYNTHPTWENENIYIPCNTTQEYNDDFELFGNLLFYGNKHTIRIYDIFDILDRKGYDSSFIDSSDFYNKKICVIPYEYSTFSENITLGGPCQIEFSNVKKEFVSKNSITLMPGTTISDGSEITFRIDDEICNSIISYFPIIPNNTLNTKIINDNNLENKSLSEEKVIIFPNPTSGLVTIKNLFDEPIINLEIFNFTNPHNILIEQHNLKNNQSININLNKFPVGIYIVRIVFNNNLTIYKKIILK